MVTEVGKPIEVPLFQTLQFSEDSRWLEYVGATKNGIPWGKGKLTYKNGAKYDGNFENGTRHNFGKMIYAEDDQYLRDYYVGQFINDVQEGTGKMRWKSGETYEGEWRDGNRNGFGRNRQETGILQTSLAQIKHVGNA